MELTHFQISFHQYTTNYSTDSKEKNFMLQFFAVVLSYSRLCSNKINIVKMLYALRNIYYVSIDLYIQTRKFPLRANAMQSNSFTVVAKHTATYREIHIHPIWNKKDPECKSSFFESILPALSIKINFVLFVRRILCQVTNIAQNKMKTSFRLNYSKLFRLKKSSLLDSLKS